MPRFAAPTFHLLCLLWLVSQAFSADIAPSEKASPVSGRTLGIDEIDRLRDQQPVVVLDVRKRSEFSRGHIPGAVNLDYTEKDFPEKLAALDKHHTYLLHSNTDQRAAETSDKLARLRFQKVYTVRGGFDAWQEAGKPVEKFADGKKPKN